MASSSVYRIEIKRSAAKEIEDITRLRDRQRVVARIKRLAADPRPAGCTKLSVQEAYRVRQGDYRIIYTISDEVLVVEVIRVGHRRDVYR
ncbi:MAG: type II toxin-antitoxin system RelE/ParE family toxin [Rhodothermales bacterium]